MTNKEIEAFIKGHLSLNEGAYIFKKRQSLTKDQIKDLTSSVEPKNGYIKLYKVINSEVYCINEGDSCKRTLFVYTYNSAASYIDVKFEDCPRDLREKRSSYMLLLEYEHYIVVFKKNIGSLKAIKDCIDNVSTRKLANALIKAGTQYKKLSTTNMGMSDNSTRNISYEGNSLQTSIPMFGQNRKVVSSVSFAIGDESYGISLNTSRLAKLGSKKSLDELCIWVDEVLHAIDIYVETPSFLNNFAFQVTWSDQFGVIDPVSILFNIHSLWDYITSEGDGCIYLLKDDENDEYRRLNEKLVNKIWDFGNSMDLTFDIAHSKEKIYNVDINAKNSIVVACTKRRITVSPSGKWSDIYLKNKDGQYINIWGIINSHFYFQVGFDDCGLIYMNGSLYQDANIGESIVCDDLGDEWADHICIKGDTISFVHSKWKQRLSLSAANFQDVIGQALKNIGNLQLNGNRIDNKRKSFKAKYEPTQLYRMRKGADYSVKILLDL